MRTGAVDFAEIVTAIRNARQISISEALALCKEWQTADRGSVLRMVADVRTDARKAAIVSHAREVFNALRADYECSAIDSAELAGVAFKVATTFQEVADEVLK